MTNCWRHEFARQMTTACDAFAFSSVHCERDCARYENGGTITYGYQRTFFRKFGIQPSRVNPGELAVGATSVMVFCFRPGAVPAWRGQFPAVRCRRDVGDLSRADRRGVRRRWGPPVSASALGTLSQVLLSSAGARMAESSLSV